MASQNSSQKAPFLTQLRKTITKALDQTVPIEERADLINNLLTASVVLHRAHEALVGEIVPVLNARINKVLDARPLGAVPPDTEAGTTEEETTTVTGHWLCTACGARCAESMASQIANKCPNCGSTPITWQDGPIPGSTAPADPEAPGETSPAVPAQEPPAPPKKRGRKKKQEEQAPQGASAPAPASMASADLANELQQELDAGDSAMEALRPPRPMDGEKDTSLDYHTQEVACDEEACGSYNVIIRVPQIPGDVRCSYRCQDCTHTGFFDVSEDEAKALRENGKAVDYSALQKQEEKPKEKEKKESTKKKKEETPPSPEAAPNELAGVETNEELAQKIKEEITKPSETVKPDAATTEMRKIVEHWTEPQVIEHYEKLTGDKYDPKMPIDVVRDIVAKRLVSTTGIPSIF